MSPKGTQSYKLIANGTIFGLFLLFSGMPVLRSWPFSIVLLLLPFLSAGQDTAIVNKYLHDLKGELSDSVRIHRLCNLSWEYVRSDPDSALYYAQKAHSFAAEVRNSKGEAFALHMIALVYGTQNNFPLAVEYYLKSIAISEKNGDKRRLSDSYGNIGLIYLAMNDLAKGRSYQERALALKKEIGHKEGILTAYANLGDLLVRMGKLDSALYYYQLSAKLSDEISYKMGLSYNYRSIGGVYEMLGKLPLSLDYLGKALQINEATGNVQDIASCYVQIGSVLMRQGKHSEAIEYQRKAYAIAAERNYVDRMMTASEGLSHSYEAAGDYKNALIAHRNFKRLQDSVFSKQNFEQIGRMQANFENQKKEQDRQLLEQQKEFERQAENERQRQLRIALIAGLLLIIGFAFWRARVRKKANDKLAAAYAMVEAKNKDITDSIHYAKRIQEAILPTAETISSLFPDSFVLFRPRDVVSGDFYWFAEKDGKRLVAAVDCTGHGVPGAFMSMIGNAFLDEIVNQKGITSPGLILGELRSLVIRSLKQSGAANENKDGMDIAVVSYDPRTSELEFAGANNPLWIVREGTRFEEVKPDKRHIGFFKGLGLPFNCQRTTLAKGDRFFLFTDGYADQFGGPKGKKFKYRQLQEVITAGSKASTAEQGAQLAQVFDAWKGRLEQVDDVLVIGIGV